MLLTSLLSRVATQKSNQTKSSTSMGMLLKFSNVLSSMTSLKKSTSTMSGLISLCITQIWTNWRNSRNSKSWFSQTIIWILSSFSQRLNALTQSVQSKCTTMKCSTAYHWRASLSTDSSTSENSMVKWSPTKTRRRPNSSSSCLIRSSRYKTCSLKSPRHTYKQQMTRSKDKSFVKERRSIMK